MTFAVMITTLNRLDDLKITLSKVHNLSPPPDEVMVVADGCSDNTVEFIQQSYPSVQLSINQQSQGSVLSRARMMESTTADLVIALDDDSYPEQPDFLATVSREFEINPRLAVACFPQRTDEYPVTLDCTDFGAKRLVRSFANSGACLRVSTYRQLPGFEGKFFHMYEEPDYALQCVINDWDVVFLPEIKIRHHWVSKERSELRNHHRHARNEMWSTVLRLRFPHAFFVVLYKMLSQANYARKRGWYWLIREPIWWCQALEGIPSLLRRRTPVSWAKYRNWSSLPDK
ncbi:MAG: glycosyltransferase [Halioglobus sp.]